MRSHEREKIAENFTKPPKTYLNETHYNNFKHARGKQETVFVSKKVVAIQPVACVVYGYLQSRYGRFQARDQYVTRSIDPTTGCVKYTGVCTCTPVNTKVTVLLEFVL